MLVLILGESIRHGHNDFVYSMCIEEIYSCSDLKQISLSHF